MEYQVYRPTLSAAKELDYRVSEINDNTTPINRLWYLRNKLDAFSPCKANESASYQEVKQTQEELIKAYKELISSGDLVIAARIETFSLTQAISLTLDSEVPWTETGVDCITDINPNADLYSSSSGDLFSDEDGKYYVVGSYGIIDL